jgi:SAM-dependent methyltransferase
MIGMNGYDAAVYGERFAGVYDNWHPGYDEAAIAALAELAGGGRALELGIGTGRIALPLAARGVEVHGIDVSPSMVGKLRAKPGGEAIPVMIGDMADISVHGAFSLIYVAFNTFFGLITQEAQVRCFRSVAEHLAEGGVFLIEAFVPDPARFVRGQNTETLRVGLDEVVLTATRHDPAQQRVMSQHVVITESGTRLYPVEIRYAWPAELDLMAQLAGLRLRERWGGWRREPFTGASRQHVSLYERVLAEPPPGY